MKKDCGCKTKKAAPVHTWLDNSDSIDEFVHNAFSPGTNVLGLVERYRTNFVNSKSLVNKRLKEDKEMFITISNEEFSIKLESLML